MREHAPQDERGFVEFMELLIKNYKLEKAKSQQKPSIDEMVRLYEGEADKVILQGTAREGLAFVGGKMFVEQSNDALFYRIGMNAYFQRSNGEWIVKSNQTGWFRTEELLLDSRNELRRLGRIEFELTKPGAEGNA
ncbi:hypothetical protein MO973_25235 [Paenibacillus sp. TRM 82003]|nr:hypothetical protein [Paenibacillus sp. TRM 82003]